MVLHSTRVANNRDRLESLLSSALIWEFDDRAAVEFGQIKTELRRGGRPIPGIDAQIAAIARCNDLTILTADRHFSFVPNLKVENWLN